MCLFFFGGWGGGGEADLQHMEVPRLEVESQSYSCQLILQPQLRRIRACDLYHSAWQCRILKPLSKARDQTCILMDPSWVH